MTNQRQCPRPKPGTPGFRCERDRSDSRRRASIRGVVLFILLAIGALPACPAAGEDLRILHSRHYRVHTDVDEAFAEDLARRMDAMYDEYARRLADFRPDRDHETFDVYIFRRQQDYMRFTDNRLPNSAGVFMPARNTLAAFLEGQGRDQLRRTLQHEAFHQFAFTAIKGELPIWLNEGLAQLFEEGIWTGERFWIGQAPPRRVRQLQADIQAGKLIDFQTLLATSHDQWAKNLADDADLGATQYNQSWAMVHFLVYATDASGQAKYRARLENMLRMINRGVPPDRAFRGAFSDNIAGFQQRFLDWARTLAPTMEATLIERQDILADLLKAVVDHGEAVDSMDEFRGIVTKRRFQLTYTKGHLTWKTDSDPAAYFSTLDGRPFGRDELFFESRTFAPHPDIVCLASPRMRLRVRFYTAGDRIEHEVLIEPAQRR